MKLNTIRIVVTALLTSGALTASALGGTFTANYLGGTGVWEQDFTNWDTVAYPQNGHYVLIDGNPYPDGSPLYNVVIDNSLPCTLGVAVRAENVNVAGGSTLNLAPPGSLWANTGLGNAGLITLNSSAAAGTGIRVLADSDVADGGEIFMNDQPYNYVTAGSAGKVFTLFASGMIRGAGSLNTYLGDDLRTYLQWVNHGLIEAMQPVNPLTINLTDQAGTNGLINDATLRASGQALLRITAIFTQAGASIVANQGGTIEAIDNGTVRFASGVTVTGGTLSTSGNGSIHGDYPGNGGGTLNNVTNTGLVAIDDQETLTLAGTFTNNGSVTLNSIGNGATLRFANGTTLAGAGAITLSNNGSNYIMGVNTGDVVTIAPGATIQGAGNISPGFSGGSNMLKITNQGLIQANIASGGLNIRVEDSNNTPFTNSGTLRACNSGTLSFSGTSTLTNTGGVIEALDGGQVVFGGGVTLAEYNSSTQTLTGGTYHVISTTAPSTLKLSTGEIVTNAATIILEGASAQFLNASNSDALANLTSNQGNLQLLHGKTFTTGVDFFSTGDLRIGAGSTLTAAILHIDAGTLTGGGKVVAPVSVGNQTGPGAVLSPGFNSIGTLTTNKALNFNSDGSYKCELNLRTAKADKLVARGMGINSAAQFSFVALQRGTLPVGSVFTVISNTSKQSIAGVFANLPEGATLTAKGNRFQASYHGGDGNDLTLTVVP